MTKYAVLGYTTINIGDDIQSFVTSTLLPINYIVIRDDYDKIYDYNTGELVELNEKVYLIMNGWFMHNRDWKTGNDKLKFPIRHKYIIPIYISCCFAKYIPRLYVNECLSSYRYYGHVLCRDKTTLKMLREKKVSSSFFGCVTQLLDKKFIPDNSKYKRKYSNSYIYIDCPELWEKRDKTQKNYYFEHYIDKLMELNPKERINYSVDLLSKYKYAKKIYSGRLHAFLPCRAIGINISYVGPVNYRVKDLIYETPNKELLKRKFIDFINLKSK